VSGAYRSRHQVFAVVRVDEFLTNGDLEPRVMVKEVVWSLELAEAEVARLTALNGSKGVRYFWRATRLFPPGESAGSGAG